MVSLASFVIIGCGFLTYCFCFCSILCFVCFCACSCCIYRIVHFGYYFVKNYENIGEKNTEDEEHEVVEEIEMDERVNERAESERSSPVRSKVRPKVVDSSENDVDEILEEDESDESLEVEEYLSEDDLAEDELDSLPLEDVSEIGPGPISQIENEIEPESKEVLRTPDIGIEIEGSSSEQPIDENQVNFPPSSKVEPEVVQSSSSPKKLETKTRGKISPPIPNTRPRIRKPPFRRRMLRGRGHQQRPYSVAFAGGSPIRKSPLSPTELTGGGIFGEKKSDGEEIFERRKAKDIFGLNKTKEEQEQDKKNEIEELKKGIETRKRAPSASQPIVLKKSPIDMVREQQKKAKARPFSMRFQSGLKKFASPFMKRGGDEKESEEEEKKPDDLHNRKVEEFFKKDYLLKNIEGGKKDSRRQSWQPKAIVLGGSRDGPGGGRKGSVLGGGMAMSNRKLKYIQFSELRLDDRLNETENSVVRLCQWDNKYYCAKGVRFLQKFRKTDSESEIDEMMEKEEDEGMNSSRIPNITTYKHKGIVQIFGVSENEDWLYIVMEYMKNGDLKTYLSNENNEIRFQDKVKILKNVSETLLFLHEIKRYNVETLQTDSILLGTNPISNPKISIYKVPNLYRKLMSKDDRKSTKTYSGVFSHYRAPEIILGRSSSPKSDVFSFGMIMYEVLTLEFDWMAEEDDSLKMALNPDLRPVIDHSLFGRNEAWFINLMMKCWKQDESERPTFKDIKDEFLKKVKKLVFSAFVETLD